MNLKLAANLTVELPNFFIGFDLVGQEDLGKPLIYFANELIEEKNLTGLDYFFHAGETNWQGKYTYICSLSIKRHFLFIFYIC